MLLQVQTGQARLLNLYRPILDSWYLFDNSESHTRLIACEENTKLAVEDDLLFKQIMEFAERL